MFSEKSFDTGNVRINYAEGAPNGAPLLVLHGISDRWQGMAGLLMPLAKQWHVFACDKRGHGKSGRASSYRALDYVPDVSLLLRHKIASPAVLIGHSGGALTALCVAAQAPELVRAAVVLDPPFCLRELSIKADNMDQFMAGIYSIVTRKKTVEQALREFFPTLEQARIQWFAETLACVDPRLVKVVLDDRYFEGLELGQILAKVRCPVLMIHGDRDNGSFVRDSDLEFFLANTPAGEATRIQGAGHFLHAEHSARVLQLANQWLQRFGEFG